ncbi:unnamed protein product [Victoria cruziana]
MYQQFGLYRAFSEKWLQRRALRFFLSRADAPNSATSRRGWHVTNHTDVPFLAGSILMAFRMLIGGVSSEAPWTAGCKEGPRAQCSEILPLAMREIEPGPYPPCGMERAA